MLVIQDEPYAYPSNTFVVWVTIKDPAGNFLHKETNHDTQVALIKYLKAIRQIKDPSKTAEEIQASEDYKAYFGNRPLKRAWTHFGEDRAQIWNRQVFWSKEDRKLYPVDFIGDEGHLA